MVVVLTGGAEDTFARHGVAVVGEVVLTLVGIALVRLVLVAVLTVGRALCNHIQNSTFNTCALWCDHTGRHRN